MPEVFLLSAEDRLSIQQLLDWARRQHRNTLNRPAVIESDQSTPDVYIALTPASGIPGLLEVSASSGTASALGSGGEGLDKPRSAKCSVYRIVGGAAPDLRPVPGLYKVVYNLSPLSIPGQEWVIVIRDKFGSWLVSNISPQHDVAIEVCPIYSMIPVLSPGMGTGTALGTSSSHSVVTTIKVMTGLRVMYLKPDGTTYCKDNPTDCCLHAGTGTGTHIHTGTGTHGAGTGTSGGGMGSPLQTSCCMNQLSTIIHVTLSGTQNCACMAGLVGALVWDGIDSWIGIINTSGCPGSAGATQMQVSLHCNNGVFTMDYGCPTIGGFLDLPMDSVQCSPFLLTKTRLSIGQVCCPNPQTGTLTFTFTL